MTSTKHVNNFATTINGALTDVATSVTLTSITGLSVLTAGDKVRMTLVSASANEIVLLTYAAATSTFTVARAQESTTAIAWANGTRIEARITAGSVDSKMVGPATYTSGKIIRGNGTTYEESTPTYPNAASTSGKRIKSDGTNLVMSTTTMPDTGTNLKALVGDGTNYVERTVIQTVSAWVNTYTTGTTTVPLDDTIPQNTEGDQYLTVSITPTNASSLLRISVIVNASCSTNVTCFLSLYRDSGADAIATLLSANLNAAMNILTLNYVVSAGSTSATTFNVRMGPTAAATVRINGLGVRYGGGANATGIIVQETIA